MAATLQTSKNSISLKGSTDIVAEFFMYGINSILYQRGIYSPETFTRENKYGTTVLVTTDTELKKYLSNVLTQVKDWLMEKTVQKIVIVIKDVDSSEVLERWQFDVECDKTVKGQSDTRTKKDSDIRKEIAAVIRQITASVTFLPLIDCICAFDILVYTDKDLLVPETWGESGACMITNSQEVRLSSFSTAIHKVDSLVAYKND